jgi:hypothetical protein
MTAGSIFLRPFFDEKLVSISSDIEVHALLASMFAIAASFPPDAQDNPHLHIPCSDIFHDLATRLVSSCLDEYADIAPSLALLQALILCTHNQLARGVRGRAWRSLGTCVRTALEMQLHCLDAQEPLAAQPGQTPSNWQAKEEKRRAWWAIWEMDTFASTIRRLPAAIDWSQNYTWLPVDDASWFSNTYQPSCFLTQEPLQRVPSLLRSGNKASKAWYIVINSLPRIAQSVPYPQQTPSPEWKSIYVQNAALLKQTLDDFSIALPRVLTWTEDKPLTFPPGAPQDISERMRHHDLFATECMKSLSRFVAQHQLFMAVLSQPPSASASSPARTRWDGFAERVEALSPGAWVRYRLGVDSVVRLLRHSDESYVRYVNPFLANTVWFAAAALVTCRLYGPASVCACREADDEAFALLRGSVARFVEYWRMEGVLLSRLDSVEGRLRGLAGSERGECVGGAQHAEGVDGNGDGVAAATEAVHHDAVIGGVGTGHGQNGMDLPFEGNANGNDNGSGLGMNMEWDGFDFLCLDQLIGYGGFA